MAEQVDGPIPLSFPAILRNPGIVDRYGLQSKPLFTPLKPLVVKRTRRDENEGRRWVRRKDNARFVGNPHIVAPTKRDAVLQPTSARNTFPEPLPSYLPRNAKVPVLSAPSFDPNSANAGRFSLSLRGMRKDLRKAGFRAQALVRDIEKEILDWLHTGGTMISPDSDTHKILQNPGRPIRDTVTIFEASRSPIQLVWRVTEDSFARYVVHCCARYHEIVSFSKDISGERLTYLLRPNVAKPDAHVLHSIDTPPPTDLEYSSVLDTGSELSSDREALSDIGESDAEPAARGRDHQELTPISEGERPSSPTSRVRAQEEDWLLVGDTDAEGDESDIDAGLAASVDSLSIHPLPTLSSPPTTVRARLRDRQSTRSSSSPSPSPTRRQSRKQLMLNSRRQRHVANPKTKSTLFEYLFDS